MTREDEFAKMAAEYAAADADVIEAERQANQMRLALEKVRKDRDALGKKLGGFVGPNIRTRNAVVGFKLVRAAYTPGAGFDTAERVDVSVEDVTLAGVEVREGSP